MTTKDELRAALFDVTSRKRLSKPLTIHGTTIELRQPTLAQLSKLADSKGNKIPGLVNVLIEYAYVPGTDEKMFTIGDAATLAELPSGKWIDDLNKAFEEMAGVEVKEAEKNSAATD